MQDLSLLENRQLTALHQRPKSSLHSQQPLINTSAILTTLKIRLTTTLRSRHTRTFHKQSTTPYSRYESLNPEVHINSKGVLRKNRCTGQYLVPFRTARAHQMCKAHSTTLRWHLLKSVSLAHLLRPLQI